MKIIHIVSSVSSINFGVWNAAIFASEYLKRTYNVSSELWICSLSNEDIIKPQIPYFYFQNQQKGKRGFRKWVRQFDKSDTVIVTHGAWLLPTRLGYIAHEDGYKWIYTPHGMFEPDNASSGKLKKYIYYNLFEKRLFTKSDRVRAVSESEKENLEKKSIKKVVVIYNGVTLPSVEHSEKSNSFITFLFLARLQKKKGLIFLVKAWSNTMYDCPNVKLIIAGPDEGELEYVNPYLKKNIAYYGPVYGADKVKLLQEAHYYVLPSFSEGFPTSVVEAMSYGIIPIISSGCNFPEVFKEHLGFKVEPDEDSIEKILKQITNMPFDNDLSQRNIEFVKKNLTDKIVGDKLYFIYNQLFTGY